MRPLLVLALLVMIETGCGGALRQENERLQSENDALIAAQTNNTEVRAQLAAHDAQLAVVRNQLLTEEQRIECALREVDAKHTCDWLNRYEDDAATRNAGILECLGNRGFKDELGACGLQE